MNIELDFSEDPSSSRNVAFAVAQATVPLEQLKAASAKIARESQSSALAAFEKTDAAKQLSNLQMALDACETDERSAAHRRSIAEAGLASAAKLGDPRAISQARQELAVATADLAGIVRQKEILKAADKGVTSAADRERDAIVAQTRNRLLQEMGRRAERARVVIVEALQSPAVTAAIIDFAIARWLIGLGPVKGDLPSLANFRMKPPEETPISDSEFISSKFPSPPRRAAVGLPVG